MAVAVILAGGMGTRFGGQSPKQLAPLAGYTVLHHAVRKFDLPGLIDSLVVVANATWRTAIEASVEGAIRNTPFVVVDGGSTRNESLRNALGEIDSVEDRVLIHDGVRPLVNASLIERVLDALEHSRCVIPIIPSADPLVRIADGAAVEFPSRSEYFRGQSPQGFYLSDLRKTFQPERDAETLGMATVYEALLRVAPHTKIGTVQGAFENIKITMPVDQMIAGRLLLEE